MSESKNIEGAVKVPASEEGSNVALLKLHNFQPIKREISKKGPSSSVSKRKAGSSQMEPYSSDATKGNFEVLEGL